MLTSCDVAACHELDGKWFVAGSGRAVIYIRGPGRYYEFHEGFRGAARNTVFCGEVPHDARFLDPAVELRNKKYTGFSILRHCELGDVIVALAALRLMRRLPDFGHIRTWILHTFDHFHPILRCQNEVMVMAPVLPKHEDHLCFDFNNYFELDHLRTSAKVSRVDRVIWTFGVILSTGSVATEARP